MNSGFESTLKGPLQCQSKPPPPKGGAARVAVTAQTSALALTFSHLKHHTWKSFRNQSLLFKSAMGSQKHEGLRITHSFKTRFKVATFVKTDSSSTVLTVYQ